MESKFRTGLRTHTCGELRITDVNKVVSICGWVQKARKMGAITFVDVRDRYGITQIVSENDPSMFTRETVVRVTGTVRERESKNKN